MGNAWALKTGAAYYEKTCTLRVGSILHKSFVATWPPKWPNKDKNSIRGGRRLFWAHSEKVWELLSPGLEYMGELTSSTVTNFHPDSSAASQKNQSFVCQSWTMTTTSTFCLLLLLLPGMPCLYSFYCSVKTQVTDGVINQNLLFQLSEGLVLIFEI